MGIRTKVKWNGDVNFTYDGRDLVATVKATAEHWYQAERKYLANGDPGYPEEDEIEDIEFDVIKICDEEEEIEYTEDMVDYVEAAIQEQAEWEDDAPDWDEPDYDECYEEEKAIAKYESDCESMGC